MKNRPLALLTFFVFLVLTPYAWSQTPQTPLDAEEQRRRTQQELEDRLRRQQAPDVRPQDIDGGVTQNGAGESADTATPDPDALDLPEETPCFPLTRLEVDTGDGDTNDATAFTWAQPWLDRYAGLCVGREGIERILRRLSSKITAQGYVTTRVGLPEQALTAGTLRLQIQPGRIGAIRFAEETDISWRSAFPTRPGDLLNLRDIEQALEQFKRIPSQDVNIQIAPGTNPGESDLIITRQTSKPWRLALTADDSGSAATGRRQGSATLTLDNPLRANDTLSLGLNYDLWNKPRDRGSGGHNISYTIPWGNWTIQLTDSAWQYRQTIQGINQTFLYSGDSQSDELRITRNILRERNYKTSLYFRTLARTQKSAIEHVDIAVQNQRTALAELGVVHRHYLGNAQLDLTLAHREGVPWFGGKKDAPDKPADAPTYRYRLNTLDIALLTPFQISSIPLRWNSALRLQHTTNTLYATDTITIGSRYTVRGFDGERTLAAARGGYWRNDLEIPLGNTAQTLYLGLDAGRVSGPGAEFLPGKTLTGSAVGFLGGTTFSGITVGYDIFAGWALNKPAALTTTRPATGIQIYAQY